MRTSLLGRANKYDIEAVNKAIKYYSTISTGAISPVNKKKEDKSR